MPGRNALVLETSSTFAGDDQRDERGKLLPSEPLAFGGIDMCAAFKMLSQTNVFSCSMSAKTVGGAVDGSEAANWSQSARLKLKLLAALKAFEAAS